jgi:membrane-associated PAP2 superfamily phosphatase
LQSLGASTFDRDFWRIHALWPGVLLAAVLGTLYFSDLDIAITQHFFYDTSSQHWLGTGGGQWWAHRLFHSFGRWVPRAIAAAAFVLWALSFRVPPLRPWRRSAGYVLLAMALATGIVGGLKEMTNVDCPWNLAGFGGDRPYIHLFADRPDNLARASCFPGAHSSSGFALLCFYFLLRDRSRRTAYLALAAACAVGVAFSIGQEARGAHFLSHDLTSAGIVWFVQLGMYAWLLKQRALPPHPHGASSAEYSAISCGSRIPHPEVRQSLAQPSSALPEHDAWRS